MKTEVFVEKLLNSNEPIENIVIDYIEERNPDFQRELEYVELPGLEMPVIRIGLLELDDSATLHFYLVKMDGTITERSSKKRQFEIAKKILSNQFADAGIFFFHDENRNFRISFVYKQYFGTKEKYSHYKRYTFFLSKERPFKTFITQLKDVTWKNLKEIKEAFSVQPLTKQFYKELQAWYFYAMDKVKFPEDYRFSDDPEKDKEIRNATNLIRLLTRLIFVWFLREKELIPEKLFDESQLKHIVKDFLVNEESRNYYNAILQNLFFATLNQRQKDRAFASEGGKPYNPHYGVKTLYRYADKFLISKEEVLELFRDIPFLNGGLFDCLDKEDPENNNKVVYIDGFSRNPSKQAIIPDYLFFNDKEIIADLSAYGLSRNEKVRGLFNIFRDYNWTTDEASPIDEEIALDPELLGKVFENLLASYNPETSASARKATGSYYTPREIVDFMVEESLVEYLKDKVPEIEEERIRLLISYSDELPEFSENEKEKLLQAIDEIKILDPACGSGAFPMGILHKLVHIIERLDPENIHWRELQRKKIREEIVQVFQDQEITDEEIKRALKELQEVFDESLNYPDYARKLYIIENSIYGVDIQPIAVQISKLRFFISLILDQKIDKTKENFGIRPLPNLETKFVAANTLIGLEKGTQISLGESVIHQDAEELRRLRHRYFTAKTRRQKVQLQEKDKKLREKIKKDLISVGFPSESAEKIASFDPFDPNASADWFDSEWMFGVKDGFDIVIGNPPYVRQERIKPLKPILEKQNYEVFTSTADLYVYFYEKGYRLLKDKGILTYITSNKWMRAKYGEKLRRFLKENAQILELVDFGGYRVFEQTVDTNIILLKKEKPSLNHELKYVEVKSDVEDSIKFIQNNWQKMPQSKLSDSAWTLADDRILAIKEKIEKIGKPLKDWDVKIYRGVLTGYNEAFIIDTETRNRILKNCKTEEERRKTEEIIKPVLRGRDIGRYYYQWAGMWLILIPAGWTNQNRGLLNPEEFFRQTFPSLYNYFMEFSNVEFRGRQKGLFTRDDRGDYWWELRHCDYYSEFEKEKIVWQRVTKSPKFALVSEVLYCEATTHFITHILSGTPKITGILKFILGILNSELFEFAFYKFYMGGGIEGEIKGEFIGRFPIPEIEKLDQADFITILELVEKIIDLKMNSSERQTADLEKQIDRIVYKFYNLTEDEIQIIEESRTNEG
ncbi:type IIS restriction endonuclease [Fervidobacterium ngatamarikiense]|uniref:site-specific DNA-methyltransferase (adenine-specific) n=1 Tax=Fervidobacterium pennivorans TaxID=93466 RepID=A0A172T2K7_FERPE|nr:Eco57I restriction-modification methylase domain-containing protein [Fervidobacterium pennivorans]ANE41194.1 type IIS restriction endonuclease [Fervidobacterium pennivorans]